MPKKRFSSEQIIAKLRQIEVQLAQGKSIALACKDAAVSEQSYFRWRKEYGGVPIGAGQAPEGPGAGECPPAPPGG